MSRGRIKILPIRRQNMVPVPLPNKAGPGSGDERRSIPRTLLAWFWLLGHDAATRLLDGAREVPFSCFNVLNDNPPFSGFPMQVSSFCEKDELTPISPQP